MIEGIKNVKEARVTTEVERELEKLDGCIVELEGSYFGLIERLVKVLTPCSGATTPNPPPTTSEISLVPLASSIRELRRRIEGIDLVSLMSRIEL